MWHQWILHWEPRREWESAPHGPWVVDADLFVKSSRGWYDVDDYSRQTGGG